MGQLQKGGVFNEDDKELFKKFTSLTNSMEYEEECDYKKMPNYQEIRHFEEEISDSEFMDIIIDRLQGEDDEVSYKKFKSEFLPKHRKPTFNDYLRFRRLETIMLH